MARAEERLEEPKEITKLGYATIAIVVLAVPILMGLWAFSNHAILYRALVAICSR